MSEIYINKSSILFAALALLAACSEIEIPVPVADILTAQIEQDASPTKTNMDAGYNIYWSEGDQFVGFMKSSLGLKYQILPSSVGKTPAFFEKVSDDNDNIVVGTELDHNVAYYPYSASVEAARSESGYTLNVTLPSEQTYVPDSFGEGAMAMVAVSETNNFTFRNILGGMKLQLKGTQTVTSISLEGRNSEKLSGAATITAYPDGTKPAISMSDGASASLTLNCGSGVQLNENTATVFIIALPPVTFSQGFTVTVTDNESQTYTVKTDMANTVLRSNFLVIPSVTLGALEEEEFPENTTVEYIDENGVNRGYGIEIDGVIWAPVNCGYHETDFKYGKLYQWGRKYGQGYEGELVDVYWNRGTYSDSSVPTLKEGSVSLSVGQSKSNENYFYTISSEPFNWLSHRKEDLWNLGTEDSPIKTEYDPCPEGWRVPTSAELDELCKNHSSHNSGLDHSGLAVEDGQSGYWFSGASPYSERVPRVFFLACGGRSHTGDLGLSRGYSGIYWSSRSFFYEQKSRFFAFRLLFYGSNVYSPSNGNSHSACGYSVRCVKYDGELIPISSLTISDTSLSLEKGKNASLSATITPSNATHQSACWWSEDPLIATVDQNGRVTAVADGTTIITAMAGMQTATCEVKVGKPVLKKIDYVDEYDVNHGPGVEIDGVIWAPVNCGYHETDFKYGKLYQWGRKYGQGYDGDATVPEFAEGGVSVTVGNQMSNANIFYRGSSDWADSQNDDLWNSGVDLKPIKTEYDPCPEGWRVPTFDELRKLYQNLSPWTTDEAGQVGYWFSGSQVYSSSVPRVFFPAAGFRGEDGKAYDRGTRSYYASSKTVRQDAYSFYFKSSMVIMGRYCRACGHSVRCVQVTD